MRKVLVALVLAIVGVLAAATTAEAADSLRASRARQVRGGTVTYAGTATGCRTVVIASRPGGGGRALNRQRQRVVGGQFRFVKVVRRNAALRSHKVRVRCVQDGRLVGEKGLRVGGQIAIGGIPVLPQLLLGLGLLEAGVILIGIGRRPQFPKTRRGPSSTQRKSVHVYAD